MTKVAVVGCGIVGAAIAYELSQVPELTVTVLDRQLPAQAATGAALGVLMGVISQKTKGNNLKMRLFSIQRYNDWIPQLETITGHKIPFNREGILRLCFEGEALEFWQTLAEVRQSQGWQLKICDRAELASAYPQLNLERIIGAVYSPQDRQVDPTALTLALVAAAQHRGVQFQFNTAVTGADCLLHDPQPGAAETTCQIAHTLHTTAGDLAVDWVVIASGLGSTPLTAALQHPVEIRPVLGQAMRIKLQHSLGHAHLQPAITGNDVHLVPLGDNEYWVGATVEFAEPPDRPEPIANAAALDHVMQQAIAFCPALAAGTIVQTWSGLRPRPEGRPAPIIELLPGHRNVILASGHYRNGVLLAPATATKVAQMITG